MKHMKRRREGALTRLQNNIAGVKRELNRKRLAVGRKKVLQKKLNRMETEAAVLKERLSLS